MKKPQTDRARTTRRKRILSPAMTAVTFLVGMLLLLSGSIGGARAALTYYSENYTSRVQMYDIGVTLLENGEAVSWRNFDGEKGAWNEEQGALLGNMLGEGEKLRLGQAYPEELKVQNTGSIGQYVRVTIYRYWVDGAPAEEAPAENASPEGTAEGEKRRDLDPSQIGLHLTEGSGWLLDTASSTPERIVLYYEELLEAGAVTAPFADTLTIDDRIALKVSQETSTRTEGGKTYTTTTTTYDYDGVEFRLEAKVDAVQEHNAEAAIRSAWGKEVTVADGRLSLVSE